MAAFEGWQRKKALSTTATLQASSAVRPLFGAADQLSQQMGLDRSADGGRDGPYALDVPSLQCNVEVTRYAGNTPVLK